ncbi:MAG TPA: PEP-CTERM sorting domain-containing protein [Pirellulales bacterium]|jgi:hypothetical protein|nr:PEP-CTERM sorting domain-containing protein [Pirellulales bacterium]
MKYCRLIASVSVAVYLLAGHSEVSRSAPLLFPQLDGNGNEITSPVTTSFPSVYYPAGIGFKHPNSPGDPNSPYIPFTVPDPTTLIVTDGGNIPISEVIVANASTLSINGTGQVGGNVDVYDTSTVNMSGSSMLGFHPGTAALFGHDQSKLNISGGTIAGGLEADDQSIATLSGGQVNLVSGFGGTVNVTGGTVVNGAQASAGGTVNISTPEDFGAGLAAYNGSHITMSAGGRITLLQASDNSDITLNGVTLLGNVNADNSIVNYGGGTIVGNIFSQNGASVTTSADMVTGTVNANGGFVHVKSGTVGSLQASGMSLITIEDGVVVGDTVVATDTGAILVHGGTINGTVSAQGTSVITLDGPTVAVNSDVNSYDTSKVNLFGTQVTGTVSATDTSLISLYAASVTGDLGTFKSGLAVINGDTTISGNVVASNSSHVQLVGGTVGSVTTYNSASAQLDGSQVKGDVSALNSSSIMLDNMFVTGNITAQQQSIITISDSITYGGQIEAFGTSRIVLLGHLLPNNQPHAVVFDGIEGSGPGLLAPDGEPAFASIFLHDSSSLEFDGHSLSAALIDPLNGGGAYSEYEISGLFADGAPIPSGLDLFVANGSAASFQLVEAVPEPASVSLMAVAALALLARRRQTKIA